MRLPRGARRVRIPTAAGITLSVVVAGSGPTLLLLHGFTGSGAAWGDVPLRLARHHTVVVPDLPGHGDSDPAPDPESHRWDRLVDVLVEVLDEVAEGPAIWAGYSMGGRLALCAAASGRVDPSALVLESTSPGLDDDAERAARRASDEGWAEMLDTGDLASFVDAWLERPVFASQRLLPRLIREAERARRLEADAAGLAASLRGFGAGAQPSWWDRLSGVKRPVLLLTGALDQKFDALAQRMSEHLPHARRRSVRGAGHAVHLEKPEAWLAEVSPFLEEVRAGTSRS